jgi:hypothetical protein
MVALELAIMIIGIGLLVFEQSDSGVTNAMAFIMMLTGLILAGLIVTQMFSLPEIPKEEYGFLYQSAQIVTGLT